MSSFQIFKYRIAPAAAALSLAISSAQADSKPPLILGPAPDWFRQDLTEALRLSDDGGASLSYVLFWDSSLPPPPGVRFPQACGEVDAAQGIIWVKIGIAELSASRDPCPGLAPYWFALHEYGHIRSWTTGHLERGQWVAASYVPGCEAEPNPFADFGSLCTALDEIWADTYADSILGTNLRRSLP